MEIMETIERSKAGPKRGVSLTGLKNVRESRGLSGSAAALRCGISASFFSRLETGEAGAGYQTMQSIIAGLKTNEAELTGAAS